MFPIFYRLKPKSVTKKFVRKTKEIELVATQCCDVAALQPSLPHDNTQPSMVRSSNLSSLTTQQWLSRPISESEFVPPESTTQLRTSTL